MPRKKLTTYEKLMREAKKEYEQAMKAKKKVSVKTLLDHTLPNTKNA